jgi:serine phosphatase RsbU (regulator of sigma subunit)
MQQDLTARRRRRLPVPLIIWLSGIVAILAIGWVQNLLRRIDAHSSILGFCSFLAWFTVIGLTLYGIAVAIRFLLRRLFWRVGRRLLLSYFLIGLLPFFLFAVLLAAILYVIAGVASQASFKQERQGSIGQIEGWINDYAVKGTRPREAEKSLEIYDSANATGALIPEWLRKSNFSGMAARDRQGLLVVSRQSPGADQDARTIAFVQPLDKEWARQLEDRTGMVVAQTLASRVHTPSGHSKIRIQESSDANFEVGDADGEVVKEFAKRGFSLNRVYFFDITEEGGLLDWETGDPQKLRRVFALISIPWNNLLQLYFSGATSSKIMRGVFGVITGLTSMLMIIYLLASAFAAVLIFSISRAVNRIEKGTKAVERGDFTYRINMKPQNQLGEMAQSFDRMTESIAQLLVSVAEKERLQSEIAIAASIQKNLLPREGPQFRGVSFSAHFEPTASIGGDYYDVFNLDKSRLAVAIGDVSGHGLSTGLVMAMVKAAITTLVEEGAEERSLFKRLNELVFRSTERRAFMTLAFTVFDLEHGTIRHTNAGHLYPYLLRNGRTAPIPIESPSLPLGVRHEFATKTIDMSLEEGDAVVYLSDGIVEAQDANGDPFGFDELERLLTEQSDHSPDAIRDAILRAVAAHAGTRPADDDRTVMILRFENFRLNLAGSGPKVTEAEAVVS